VELGAVRKDKKGAEGAAVPRKRVEGAAKGADKLLQTLLDHTHMLVAYLDPKFNFVRVNRAYAKADERDPSFYPGKNHFDLYPNTENEGIFKEVVKTGKPYFAHAKPFEYAEYPERGTGYWDWSLIPIKDPTGAVTGLVLTLVNVTERRRAEEKITLQNEFLNSVIESVTHPLYVIDVSDYTIKAANSAARLGSLPESPTCYALTHRSPKPCDGAEHPCPLEEIKRTKKPVSVEHVHYDKDGNTRNLEIHAYPILDSQGDIVQMIEYCLDITPRKQAEEALRKARDGLETRVQDRTRELSAANIELKGEVAERQRAEEKLRESEEKYKTLVETSNDMIFTVDLKGNFLFTNQAFGSVLGYSAEEIGSLNGFELVHPEDSKTARQQFARLVEGESVDNMEYRYKRKDGSYISILNNAAPVFDSDGNVVAAFGVARDITRRKQADKAMQESELWMRNMFNSLEEAVLVVTPDRALVNINEAAKRMFGYEKDELVDLSTEVLHVDHEHYVEFGRRIQQAFDKGKAASFEFEAKHKNGEVFPTEHTVTLLKNDIGESLGIVSVVRDVTERRRAERELNQYREHLEELVEERTAELKRANERLAREVTERKRAQEALRAEKEFTERALSAQTDTFFVFEPSTGRAVRWNKAFNEISGYSDEEIRSMKAPDSYYSQEDLKKAAAAAQKILREGVATVELSLITKDGRSIPTEYTGSAITDDEDNPKYIIAVGRDVTERKRAQDELRKSKELFEKTFNSQQDAMFILDARVPPTIVDCNPSATKTFGFARQEMLGRTTAFLHVDETTLGEFQARVYPAIEKQGFVYLPEFQMKRKDGAIIQTEHAVTPLTDQQGRRIGWVSVVRDITERKRAEEELRKRTYDLGERIKELNCLYNIGKLIETPGMSLEQIFRGTVDLIPPAWQYPEITCARLQVGDRDFATGNFRETIWRQISDISVHGDREGTLEAYYLEERPERNEGPFLAEERSLLEAIVERLGRVIERKRAEEEIQKLNESLKVHAAELAAANKELEAFSYSVSHDLRAPLRTIDGFSRALLEDYDNKLEDQGKDYLKRVRAATQRMGQLIDDLLNLSLMMRKELRREETDLSDLARSIAAELRKTQPRRQAEFVIQEGVVAHGDPRLLREVLENLLGNAWKFTEKHSRPRIEFGASQQEEQSAYFVRDNGAGFDMAYADKLFVPFQRLHSTAEFSGNGIGLTIASRIINRHGGRIWAEGELEKGATFYFTLK